MSTPQLTANEHTGLKARTGEVESLVSRLAVEMADSWRKGERPRTEDFLDRYPELWDRPSAALELIAEELAVREEYGEPISPSMLARRFPRWRDQVRALGDCHREMGGRPGISRFPEAGTTLGDFRLGFELGRGASGRVFAATQSSLGSRPVVLKLSSPAGSEHLSLARLQHTHIVPIHSVHEFPDRGLIALCMPYFGGATLATVLAALADRPVPTRTGADLVTTLRGLQARSPLPIPVQGPGCDSLAASSYTHAICRIGVCLARALQFAHDRGLLHLDIKPSNVLIAADGVPMLLDFHLARPPLRVGDLAPTMLGGTPGYMAPEHALAIHAVHFGSPITQDVDPRADIYSLGVLLGEALACPTHRPAAHVPRGLLDILARCKNPDPAKRYSAAKEVAADLQRHLADLPLKGVGNRSIVERWKKWRRRRPFTLPIAAILLAVGLGCLGLALRAEDQANRARAAQREGESRLRDGRFAEALEAFRNGESLIAGMPFHSSLAAQLRESRLRAERGLAAAELHQFCDRVRPFYLSEHSGDVQIHGIAARCRQLWAERESIVRLLDTQPDRQWRADLLDLGIVTAELEVRVSPASEGEAAHRRALATLEEVERLLGPSAVLYLERAEHARAVGLSAMVNGAMARAETLAPTSAWEHLVVGRARLKSGALPFAVRELDRSLALEPESLWGNYYRGLCALRLGQSTDANAAFSVCVALGPHTGWCFYNRGLARIQAGRFDDACSDFDRALELDGGITGAYLARSVAHSKLGQHAQAMADLRLASSTGLATPAVAYLTATIQLAAGDRGAAVASLRECLALDPEHHEARLLLDRLRSTR